jgi:radical SAM protein with 4Fe4S-binding SPASM domain
MLFRSRLLRRSLVLLPPDIEEQRGNHHLLVWGDVPHWMVVDAELKEFLGTLDGRQPLSEQLVRSHARELKAVCRQLAKLGVLHDKESLARRDPSDSPRIESLAINLTSGCNLRCAFCYNHTARAVAPNPMTRRRGDTETRRETPSAPLPDGCMQTESSQPAKKMKDCGTTDTSLGTDELSSEEFCTFLDAARPLTSRGAALVILGGEPFLQPRKLFAVVRHARRLGLVPTVSTNGTRIDGDIARECRKNRLHVQVSVDGADAPSHEGVRGKGTFQQAIDAVRTLVESQVRTVMSMVCHAGNMDQLEPFLELAQALRVEGARFIPLKQMGRAGNGVFQPVSMTVLMARAADLLKRRPEFRRLLGRDAFSIIANTCRVSARRPSCGTGRQTLLLDADGWMYPCLNMKTAEFRIAQIRESAADVKRIWQESAVLRDVRTRTSVTNCEHACSRCPVRFWCLGGCRGETWAVTGNLAGVSPHCQELKRSVLDMMWLLAESPELAGPAQASC